MPPRHTYWTIILEGKPTAFRAHAQDELLPTLRQLQSKHPDAVLMWFARGRLWKSEEESRAAYSKSREGDRRGPAWRPGGSHEDPRARFKIPRDEKRRRFREKLFGKDGPDDQAVPAAGERTAPPPPAPETPIQKPAHPTRDERPPSKSERPPIPTGPAEGPRRSGLSDRKPEWKPRGPTGQGSRGWKPHRPGNQGGGDRDRVPKHQSSCRARTGRGPRTDTNRARWTHARRRGPLQAKSAGRPAEWQRSCGRRSRMEAESSIQPGWRRW